MQKLGSQKFPLISVIIPIYNVYDYLEECLDSLCRQTYKNIEVILVDDGSTDKSNELCRAYLEKDGRFRLIEKSNGGQISARKAGLRSANGTYIAFVDADDWVDDDFLEQVLPYITGKDAADIVAFGCVEEYLEYGVKKWNSVEAGIYRGCDLELLQHEMLMTDNFFEWGILPHLCDKIMKKEIVERNIGVVADTITFGEDAACVFPCMLDTESVAILRTAPYHYRQREGSAVKEMRELERANFMGLYRVLGKAFGDERRLQEQLRYYMFFALLLKAYSELSNSMVLFPFEKVRQGSHVLVYGAGGFGKVIEQFARNSQDLELAGWADKNAAYYQKCGWDIVAPNEVVTKQFDYLVIAILNENLAKRIQDDLIEMGVNPEKIDFVRKDILKKQPLPSWLEDMGEG